MTNKSSTVMKLKILHLKLLRKMRLPRPLKKTKNNNKMPKRKLNLKRKRRFVQMLMKKLRTVKPLSQVLITASMLWRATMVETEMIMSLQLTINLKTKKKKNQNSSIKDHSPRSRNQRWTSSISTLRHQSLRMLKKVKQNEDRIRRTFNLLQLQWI